MIHSQQPPQSYQSHKQSYYFQNSQQTFRPSHKQQKEYSPFQSLSEELFTLPQKQLILEQKSSYFYTKQNSSPQSYNEQAIPTKQYFQKPFAKIPLFKINEIQIVIPQQTARFQQKIIDAYHLNQKDQPEKSPREGIKKKKISLITKPLTSRLQNV